MQINVFMMSLKTMTTNNIKDLLFLMEEESSKNVTVLQIVRKSIPIYFKPTRFGFHHTRPEQKPTIG